MTPPPKKGGGAQHDTSEAEREFDKVARRNEHLAADISIVLFTDMWVTPIETLLASVTRSLPRLPLSGCLSVCVRAGVKRPLVDVDWRRLANSQPVQENLYPRVYWG